MSVVHIYEGAPLATLYVPTGYDPRRLELINTDPATAEDLTQRIATAAAGVLLDASRPHGLVAAQPYIDAKSRQVTEYSISKRPDFGSSIADVADFARSAAFSKWQEPWQRFQDEVPAVGELAFRRLFGKLHILPFGEEPPQPRGPRLGPSPRLDSGRRAA